MWQQVAVPSHGCNSELGPEGDSCNTRVSANVAPGGSMPTIGYHASHEQFAPSELLASRPNRRAGRFRRRDVLGPLRTLERAAGALQVCLVLAGSRVAGDVSSFRRGQCPGDAITLRSLPRPRRHLTEMFPIASGSRSAPGRRSTSTLPARAGHQGRAQRAPAGMRRCHPRPLGRRDGDAPWFDPCRRGQSSGVSPSDRRPSSDRR